MRKSVKVGMIVAIIAGGFFYHQFMQRQCKELVKEAHNLGQIEAIQTSSINRITTCLTILDEADRLSSDHIIMLQEVLYYSVFSLIKAHYELAYRNNPESPSYDILLRKTRVYMDSQSEEVEGFEMASRSLDAYFNNAGN